MLTSPPPHGQRASLSADRLPSQPPFHMKITPKLIALVTLGLAFGAARADTFNFSYVFGDGLAVTGSLKRKIPATAVPSAPMPTQTA